MRSIHLPGCVRVPITGRRRAGTHGSHPDSGRLNPPNQFDTPRSAARCALQLFEPITAVPGSNQESGGGIRQWAAAAPSRWRGLRPDRRHCAEQYSCRYCCQRRETVNSHSIQTKRCLFLLVFCVCVCVLLFYARLHPSSWYKHCCISLFLHNKLLENNWADV